MSKKNIKRTYAALTCMVCMQWYLIFTEVFNEDVVTSKTFQGDYENRGAFTTYFKEPLVIEKKIVVYVEKEPTEGPTTEVISSINYQYINGYFDVFLPSNYSHADLTNALGSGSRSGLTSIIDAVMEAEDIYGVNALYLLATLGYESGWGQYTSANNNLAGWKSSTTGGFKDFDSEYQCVMTVANGLANSFKDDVGNSLAGVTARYCPDPGYTDTLIQIMSELQYNIDNGGN